MGISTVKLRFSRVLKNYKSGIRYIHDLECQMLNLETHISNLYDGLRTHKDNHHNKTFVAKLTCTGHITISKQLISLTLSRCSVAPLYF